MLVWDRFRLSKEVFSYKCKWQGASGRRVRGGRERGAACCCSAPMLVRDRFRLSRDVCSCGGWGRDVSEFRVLGFRGLHGADEGGASEQVRAREGG